MHVRTLHAIGALSLGAVALVACGGSAGASTAVTAGGEAEEEAEECTATLRLESLEQAPKRLAVNPDPVEVPHMRVTAVRLCERSGPAELVVGDEVGVCTRAASGGSVVAHVSCWWVGRTSEVVLLHEDARLVVLRSEAGEGEPMDRPREIGALELPEGAELVPLDEAGR